MTFIRLLAAYLRALALRNQARKRYQAKRMVRFKLEVYIDELRREEFEAHGELIDAHGAVARLRKQLGWPTDEIEVT